MNKKPVLLLLFNRPEFAEKLLDALKITKPNKLYIAVDGPREGNLEDAINCEKCCEVVQFVDWPCEIKTLFRKQNKGCKAAVKESLEWFFNFEEEGIILEDDCIPDPSFFDYCSDLLEYYRHDQRILTIGGSNMGHPRMQESYGFTPFMNMWGWATWRDRSIKIDYEMREGLSLLGKIKLFRGLLIGRPSFWHLDYRWFLHWCESFRNNISGITKTWDLPWIYYGLINGKCSIFPCVNLIQNIGFGINSTHTTNCNSPLSNIPAHPISIPLKHQTKK